MSNELNGKDALVQLFESAGEAGRALPLPNLSDEAVALLTACNGLLNNFALQGVAIPPRLLSDLTLFCRENIGYTIPFSTLATMKVDTGPGLTPESKLERLAWAIREDGQYISAIINNLVAAKEKDCLPLLGKLGEIELKIERLYQFFGWSKMIVRTAARLKLDADEAKQEK